MSIPDRPTAQVRSWFSRALSTVDRAASRPHVGIIVIGADAIWILTSVLVGFPAPLETVFQTLIAGVTVAMLFVLQHTQARHQAATQRKLDEILLSLPGADNTVLSIENAADEELRAVGESHSALRDQALRDGSPGGKADSSDSAVAENTDVSGGGANAKPVDEDGSDDSDQRID